MSHFRLLNAIVLSENPLDLKVNSEFDKVHFNNILFAKSYLRP